MLIGQAITFLPNNGFRIQRKFCYSNNLLFTVLFINARKFFYFI